MMLFEDKSKWHSFSVETFAILLCLLVHGIPRPTLLSTLGLTTMSLLTRILTIKYCDNNLGIDLPNFFEYWFLSGSDDLIIFRTILRVISMTQWYCDKTVGIPFTCVLNLRNGVFEVVFRGWLKQHWQWLQIAELFGWNKKMTETKIEFVVHKNTKYQILGSR